MRFIFFFLIVLCAFIIIFSLILLMIKYLNKPESTQREIESGEIKTLDNDNFGDKIIRVYNVILQYFDKNLIRYEEANKKLKSNYFKYIIDVRSKNEWDKGHYPIATNISIESQEQFEKNIDYYNRNLKFLIYSRTGSRAKKASDIMVKMGFKNVRYLVGTYQRLEIYKNKNELMNPN